MQVKAQGLLHATKYVEDNYGRDALGLVMRACSKGARDTYVAGNAILWHPVEELTEFLDRADAMLSDGTGRIAQEAGAVAARANTGNAVQRAAMLWTQTDFIMKRVAGMWHQFNSEGEMLFLGAHDKTLQIEVTGITKPNATFCRVLTGWCSEIGQAVTGMRVAVEHPFCLARGDRRCLWFFRTSAIDRLVPSGQRPTAPPLGSTRRPKPFQR